MKTIRKILLIAMLSGLSVVSHLRADDLISAQNGPEQNLQMLSNRFSLTDDQKPKILSILKNHALQLTLVSRNNALSDQEKLEKARIITETTQKLIFIVLTPDQRAKVK
jgi:hypothetical protein